MLSSACAPVSSARNSQLCGRNAAGTCRKPKPGLLLREPRHDLARSAIVGDRGKDVEAGVQAGVGATVFIDRGYGEPLHTKPDAAVHSLSEAVDWILSGRRQGRADRREGSARGSSEREGASEASGGGIPRK